MKELFNNYVQSLETYIMFRIKQKTLDLTPMLKEKGRSPISLSMGAPVDPPPKFVTDKLIEILQTDGKVHSYSTPKGEKYLIDAIVKRMKRVYNVELNNNEVHSLIGSKEGIANFIRSLINPTTVEKEKDIILVPDPGYASYVQMVNVSGGLAYPIPLLPENNYMPDLEQVLENLSKDGYDKKKVKAIAFNYPNNPMGVICTREYMQKAVDFCKKHNFILLADAAYIDLNLPGTEKLPSILEIPGAKDVAIEFYSFSKSYAMTGWRMGWACGNQELVGMLGKIKSSIDTGIFKPLQIAGAEILNSEAGDKFIVEENKNYLEKLNILIDGFKKMGWNTDNIKPKATFYLWLPVPPKFKSSEDFTNYALETSGVVFVPGSAFGKNGEMWFRISATSTKSDIEEAVDRLIKDGLKFQ